MNLQKNQLFAVMAFLLFPSFLFSQFTYFDIGLSQTGLVLSGNRAKLFSEVSKLSITQVHAGGLWRFNRFFGVGLDLGVPIAQKSKYTLKYSEGNFPGHQNSGDYFSKFSEDRYKPLKLDYTFKQSMQFGFIGRAFVGGTSNFFIDLKVSALKLKEDFVFERNAQAGIYTGYYDEYRPALKEESIHEKHEHFLIVPGIAIGWQPHLGDRFFMNFNLAYDLYLMKKESFSYSVPYLTYVDFKSHSNATYSVKLASQLTRTKLAVTASVRFGIFI